MSKKDKLFYSIVGIFLIAIIVIGSYKFILNKNSANPPQIERADEIVITTLNGMKTSLANLINDDGETYCLILEIYNCSSCIYKGLSEMENLEKSGKDCFCLVVHDWPSEVSGWSKHYDFQNFVSVKKSVFYKHCHSPYLPVLIKFQKGKLKSYRFISK